MKNILSTVFFAVLFAILLTPLFGGDISAGFGGLIVVGSLLPNPSGILGMNNTNNISARMSYDKARDLFYAGLRNLFPAGDNGNRDCRDFVNSRKLSQNEIRLEVRLNATNNSFTFGLTPNQNNSSGITFNTENRLTMQDSLVASEYGIFVGEPSSDTDTTWELKTYGDPITFGAGTAGALNSTFYSHGSFRMTANNDVVLPYRGLFNHWYRGQTQQTAAFGAGSPNDQIRGAEDGTITMEPNIFLIGTKGYIPQIILPVNLAATGTFTRAVLIFRGVLAQNSTTVS